MRPVHAKYSPSSAFLWANCDVYLDVLGDSEIIETPAMRNGTMLHKWAAQNLIDDTPFPTKDPVQLRSLNMYVKFSKTLKNLHVEDPVDIIYVHPTQCYGTVDCWGFDAETGTLTVVDYKSGAFPISPVENYQLLLYASGICEKLESQPGVLFKCEVKHVKLVIVQPDVFSGDPVKQWIFPVNDFCEWEAFFYNAIEAQVSEDEDDSIYSEGSEDPTPIDFATCMSCSLKSKCFKFKIFLKDEFLHFFDLDSTKEEPDARVFNFLADFRKHFTSFQTNYSLFLANLLEKDVKIKGLQLKTRKKFIRWTISDSEIEEKANSLGFSLKNPKLLSPYFALKAGMPLDFVENNSMWEEFSTIKTGEK